MFVVAVLPSGVSAVARPSDLANAIAPAMCMHDTGRLVNGVRPDIPENEGFVELIENASAVGNLMGGPGKEAAAVFSCSAGGVGWPWYVVIYSANKKPLRTYSLGDIFGERPNASASIRNGVVTVRASGIVQDGDASCCGTADGILTIRWNRSKGRFVANHRVLTEKQDMRSLRIAINNGNRRRALRFASAEAVDTMLRMRSEGQVFSGPDCVADMESPSGRRCMLWGQGWAVGLRPTLVGFGAWKANDYYVTGVD